jgi:hypothetical protein
MFSEDEIKQGLELLRSSRIETALFVEVEARPRCLDLAGCFVRWPGSGGWWPVLSKPRPDPRDETRLLIDSRSPLSGCALVVALPLRIEVLDWTMVSIRRYVPALGGARRSRLPQCTCSSAAEGPMHTCPLRSDVHGDERPCVCCPACTDECARDI